MFLFQRAFRVFQIHGADFKNHKGSQGLSTFFSLMKNVIYITDLTYQSEEVMATCVIKN